MTQEREIFPLPEFRSDQPLVEHPFYGWLLEHEDTLETRKPGILSRYLYDLGFDINRHRLDEQGLNTLHHVQDVYQTLWMPTREVHNLGDLFFPRDKKNGRTYWLRGGKHFVGSDHVVPSTTLVELIEASSTVYPLAPEHYYFDVIRGVLFLYYQHIIGSRRLCMVKEDG